MEEDIKMIEDVLKDKDTKFWIGIQGIQAIENLIARYKELEKQMGKDLDVVYIKGVYDERDKWKSKVKEKIEGLKKEMEKDETDEFGIHSISWGCLDYTIDRLQELIED